MGQRFRGPLRAQGAKTTDFRGISALGTGLSAGKVVRINGVKKRSELLNLRLGYWFVAVRWCDVARFFENLHGNKDLGSCANGKGDGIRRSG